MLKKFYNHLKCFVYNGLQKCCTTTLYVEFIQVRLFIGDVDNTPTFLKIKIVSLKCKCLL